MVCVSVFKWVRECERGFLVQPDPRPEFLPAFLRGLCFLFILSLHCFAASSHFSPPLPACPQVKPSLSCHSEAIVSTLNGIIAGWPHQFALQLSPVRSDEQLRRLISVYGEYEAKYGSKSQIVCCRRRKNKTLLQFIFIHILYFHVLVLYTYTQLHLRGIVVLFTVLHLTAIATPQQYIK